MKDIPAFPVNPDINITLEPRWAGMSLRDYFAAKAMTSLLENSLAKEFHLMDNNWMSGISMDAYSMADAMLKSRGE
jgi:hypothetical protein